MWNVHAPRGCQYSNMLINCTLLWLRPGGIRQQFQAATPMVEGLLRDLKQTEGLDGKLNAEILEDADCVGAWYGEKLLAILFPTADVLNKVLFFSLFRFGGNPF